MKGKIAASKRNKPSLSFWVLLLLLLCGLCIGGFTAARYVFQQEETGLATAGNFYFSSDYLKESSENASYYIDPKIDSFQIDLYNFADSKRWAATDIKYTVSAVGATVKDSATGILGGSNQSTGQITVVPDVKEGGSFTVTAQSTSPYQKTLTATFHLALGNQFEVDDETGNTAAVLTITCIDSGSSVSISLPGDVMPDATDDRITRLSDGYVFKPSGPGVYSVVLFKSNKSANLSRVGTAFANNITLKAI